MHMHVCPYAQTEKMSKAAAESKAKKEDEEQGDIITEIM